MFHVTLMCKIHCSASGKQQMAENRRQVTENQRHVTKNQRQTVNNHNHPNKPNDRNEPGPSRHESQTNEQRSSLNPIHAMREKVIRGSSRLSLHRSAIKCKCNTTELSL